MKIKHFIVIVCCVLLVWSCDKALEEDPFSELSVNALTSEESMESVLFGAFQEGYINGYDSHSVYNILNWCTDIEWETGGGENSTAIQMINFNWDESIDWMFQPMWMRPYRAIRDANNVLDNLDNVEDLSVERKELFEAESRFIRALSYVHLYSWFGPVPIRRSAEGELEISRPEEEEMKSFIEDELLAAIPNLPDPGNEDNYGRPNKGAARGLLTKFYLNTKQWQKAAEMAKEIMDSGNYSLYPEYSDMFKVENERNTEYILVNPQSANSDGNNYMNGSFPPNFQYAPSFDLTAQSNWNNWGAQYRLYDLFYLSFDEKDKRKETILTSYVDSEGNTIELVGDNNTRSFKFWPDSDAISNEHGNDSPEIRYADILLSRAEALNELNDGPTQESIDLINQVRNRAGLNDVSLGQFTSKKALNEHILKERGWEFYNEAGIRREDQIRMGAFISSARDRGHNNAEDYRVLFPIPQAAMDSNPKLVQNDGY